jgi:DMSO reductase family type II enzyme heme b subunit
MRRFSPFQPAVVLAAFLIPLTAPRAEALPPLDPADPAWNQAPAMRVTLYPQATTSGGPGGAPIPLEARLLRDGGRLAVRLAWPDATEDRVETQATHRFADAVAVQFASQGETLPYVGMGEPGRPVGLWFWRAGGEATTPTLPAVAAPRGGAPAALGRPGGGEAQRLAAQGFGHLEKIAGAAPEARAARTASGWTVVLRGEPRPFAAVAFAAWDGAEDGRAGGKRLSAWQALTAEAKAEAAHGGDAARGARLYAEQGCTACHAPGSTLGPDLSHAGGIHAAAYLRRSLREPAAFLVPGYPAIMPALDLKPEDVEDLVAHLLTLR